MLARPVSGRLLAYIPRLDRSTNRSPSESGRPPRRSGCTPLPQRLDHSIIPAAAPRRLAGGNGRALAATPSAITANRRDAFGVRRRHKRVGLGLCPDLTRLAVAASSLLLLYRSGGWVLVKYVVLNVSVAVPVA